MKLERVFKDEPSLKIDPKLANQQNFQRFTYSDSRLEQEKCFQEHIRLGRLTQVVLDQLTIAFIEGKDKTTSAAINKTKLTDIKRCIARLCWSRNTSKAQIYNSCRKPSVELEKISQN